MDELDDIESTVTLGAEIAGNSISNWWNGVTSSAASALSKAGNFVVDAYGPTLGGVLAPVAAVNAGLDVAKATGQVPEDTTLDQALELARKQASEAVTAEVGNLAQGLAFANGGSSILPSKTEVFGGIFAIILILVLLWLLIGRVEAL